MIYTINGSIFSREFSRIIGRRQSFENRVGTCPFVAPGTRNAGPRSDNDKPNRPIDSNYTPVLQVPTKIRISTLVLVRYRRHGKKYQRDREQCAIHTQITKIIKNNNSSNKKDNIQ